MEKKKRNIQDPKFVLTCSVKSCNSQILYALCMCRFHYERKRKGYELDPPKHTRKTIYTKCIVEGCERKNKGKYCAVHRYRKKVGIPMDIDYKKPRGTSKSLIKKHYTLKKNRLLLLEKYPVCQHCKKEPAVIAKHIDGNLDNHKMANLMAVCYKCKFLVGRKTSKFYQLYGYNSDTLCEMFELHYGRLLKLSSVEIKKRVRVFEKSDKFTKKYQDQKQEVS